MGFLDRFLEKIRGSHIDRIELDGDPSLEEHMRQLEKHIRLISKDISKIERQKKDLFKQSVGADAIKKSLLVQQIKQLEEHNAKKFKNYLTLYKQDILISNLIVLKQYDRELKQTPIWDNLKNIEPSKFGNGLINVDLKGKSFAEVLNILNNDFESSLSDDDADKRFIERHVTIYDDSWDDLLIGAIDIEEAQKIISSEEHSKQRDTEGS